MNRLAVALMCLGFCPPGAALADEPAPLRLEEARYGHGAVALHGDVYAVAGYADEGLLGSIERIPAGEPRRIETLAASFTPRCWVGAATDGTNIYVVGGIAEDSPTGLLEVWTPGEAAPHTRSPMPEPRSRTYPVYFDGRLYVIGGVDRWGERSDRVDIYDIASDAWSPGAPMPTPRECDAVLVGEKILVAGGYDGTAALDVVEIYDPQADAWTAADPLPLPQSAHHVVAVGDSVYAFGDYHALDRVTVRDSASGVWHIVDLPYQPSRHNAVAFDGREVFVLGGNTNSMPPNLDLIQRFSVDELAAAPRRAPTPGELANARRRSPAAMSRDVADVVSAWADILSQRTAIAIERTSVATVEGEPMPASSVTEVAWVSNRLFLAFDGDSMVYDGNTVFRDVPSADAYIETTASTIEDAVDRTGMYLRRAGEDIAALVSASPGRSLRAMFRTRGWERRPDESIDGTLCWALSTTSFPGAVEARETIFIAQTNGLVARRLVEATLTNEDDGRRTHHRVEQRITRLSTAEPPAETFTWRIPDGARRVANLAELMPEPEDQSRFELSGQPAPDFSLPLLDGSVFRLSDHTGSVVLIDFWATWCGPCVQAMPAIQQLHEKYADRGVRVVGVSSDPPSKEKAVRDLVERKKFTYAIGIDTNGTDEAYSVQAIPTLILVGRDGTVQYRHIGNSRDLVDELSVRIDKLLAGETLDSAEPWTEEEKEKAAARAPRRMGRTATRMDARHFDLMWSTNTPAAQDRAFMGPLSVIQPRFASPTTVIRDRGGLTVLRNADGVAIAHVAVAPGQDASSGHRNDQWVHARGPGGGILAAFRNRVEKNRDGTGNTIVGDRLVAVRMDGTEAWTSAIGNSMVASIHAIPLGADRDGILVIEFLSFRILDSEGRTILGQTIQMDDRLDILDVDGDGTIEFLLKSDRVSCYRLKPLAAEKAD